MATIRITLLSGRYGATPWNRSEREGQVEYPPAPWRLLRGVLHGAFQLSNLDKELPDDVRELVTLLGSHQPSYHLPYGEYGQIRGFRPRYGLENLPPLETQKLEKRRPFIDSFLQFEPGTSIHVHFPVELTAEQERLLNACLSGLSYLGRAEYPAIWQVVPLMPEPNCEPDSTGTLSVLCTEPIDGLVEGLLLNPQAARQEGRQSIPGQLWVNYAYAAQRPAVIPATAKVEANRALLAFLSPYGIPGDSGLAWTDRLHRALLQRAPKSALFAGLIGGQPLPEDQRAWYFWHTNDGVLSALEVVAAEPFSEHELDAIKGLSKLYAKGGLEVPVRLMKLSAEPTASHRVYRTITPMLLYTTPREGKLQRSPAGQALQSLLWGLGEDGKVDPQLFRADQHGVVLDHPVHGPLRAQVMEVVNDAGVTSRGDRKAASGLGFHVQITSEQPVQAMAVGWGRHFGAGQLAGCNQERAA